MPPCIITVRTTMTLKTLCATWSAKQTSCVSSKSWRKPLFTTMPRLRYGSVPAITTTSTLKSIVAAAFQCLSLKTFTTKTHPSATLAIITKTSSPQRGQKPLASSRTTHTKVTFHATRQKVIRAIALITFCLVLSQKNRVG